MVWIMKPIMAFPRKISLVTCLEQVSYSSPTPMIAPLFFHRVLDPGCAHGIARKELQGRLHGARRDNSQVAKLVH